MMRSSKIAITMDSALVEELDRLVVEKKFPSRSRAIQLAVAEKLEKLQRSRLALECAKLDPDIEQATAEQGIGEELEDWPEY